jgi:hypothetical protein
LISFAHIRNAENAGDMASCAADYFEFGEHEVLNYTEEPRGDTVVYGGGTLVNWLHGRTDLPKVPKVIWGAGSSRHGETEPWPDPEGVDIMGVRDWSPEREAAGLYAPCSSCMSPLFDKGYPVTRGAVAFVNANPNIRSRYPASYGTGLPTMDNTAPFEEIVAFLGSAETVVTNSYHGCWFGLLLGRKVVCIPYSSKFYGFKYPIALSDGSDWNAKAKAARVYPESLEDARRNSMLFYERVVSFIGDNP